jgi:HD superfamily phosphohydrolase YqeK
MQDEKLVKTTLILSLDIGGFPPGENAPEDYGEYLLQSDHGLYDCKIIQVVQRHTDQEEQISELKRLLSYAYTKMGDQTSISRDFYDEEMREKINKTLREKNEH